MNTTKSAAAGVCAPPVIVPTTVAIRSGEHRLATDPLFEPPWSQQRWFGFAAVPIVMLVGLAALLIAHGGSVSELSHLAIQQHFFLAINQYAASLPSQLWAFFCTLGNAGVLLLALCPLIRWYPKAWFAALAAAPIAGIFSVLGKSWASVPRPAAVLDVTSFNIIGDRLTSMNSFPSGHSITSFAAAAAVLAIVLPVQMNWKHWTLTAMIIAVASTVALARIAVGAHWPLDLVAGASVGWLAGLSGAVITNRFVRVGSEQLGMFGSRALAVLLISWSIALFTSRDEFQTLTSSIQIAVASILGLIMALWLTRSPITESSRAR